LPIEWVEPSKTNPRQHFDDVYLAELANSISDKGVVQPILVRPLPIVGRRGGKPLGEEFEIVASECRYRASKLAGKTHIPAVIRLYTDEQVLELQLIENIHRKDLTALEQAAGYRALIKSNPDKHSAASIATRIGMSEAWVWDRLKLNDLIPEAKKILERDQMTVGHAILIARLKPEDQKRVIEFDDERSTQFRNQGLWRHDSGFEFDEDDPANKGKRIPTLYERLKPCSVRELEAWIRDHIRFDVAHAAKAQPLEFENVVTRVTEAEAKPGKGKKVISITHEYRVADDARDESERTYGSESWERADGKEKSKTCEYSVLGVVVAGRGQGDTLEVCVNRDKCLVHFGAVIRQREKNAKLRESGKGKQAAKNEKKQAESADAKWRREEQERKAKKQAFDKLKAALKTAIDETLRSMKQPTPNVLHAALKGLSIPIVKPADLARVIVLEHSKRTFDRAWGSYDEPRVVAWAKTLGIDVAKIKKALAAAPAKKAS